MKTTVSILDKMIYGARALRYCVIIAVNLLAASIVFSCAANPETRIGLCVVYAIGLGLIQLVVSRALMGDPRLIFGKKRCTSLAYRLGYYPRRIPSDAIKRRMPTALVAWWAICTVTIGLAISIGYRVDSPVDEIVYTVTTISARWLLFATIIASILLVAWTTAARFWLKAEIKRQPKDGGNSQAMTKPKRQSDAIVPYKFPNPRGLKQILSEFADLFREWDKQHRDDERRYEEFAHWCSKQLNTPVRAG